MTIFNLHAKFQISILNNPGVGQYSFYNQNSRCRPPPCWILTAARPDQRPVIRPMLLRTRYIYIYNYFVQMSLTVIKITVRFIFSIAAFPPYWNIQHSLEHWTTREDCSHEYTVTKFRGDPISCFEIIAALFLSREFPTVVHAISLCLC